MSYKLTKYKKADLETKKPTFPNANGVTHCAILVQSVTDAPEVSLWIKGIDVKGAKVGDIAEGTAIGTFIDGAYPTTYPKDGRAMHAAIYISHDDKVINVFDQWKGVAEMQIRQIRFNRADKDTVRRANAGENFSVIE